MTATVPLYRALADRVAEQIANGTWRPGERVPSVRELARERGVAINTAIGAYQALEGRGLIESRPQAGWYVRASAAALPAEPAPSAPRSSPTSVDVGDLVRMILEDRGDPKLVQLGTAIPDPELLPLAKLRRSLARAAAVPESASLYDFPPGCRALRVQIAKRLARLGCRVGPDDLITTSGSQEALMLCLRAACAPGDTVAVESPTYYGVLRILEALGLKAVEIPTSPRDGMSLDGLRLALRQHRIAAVLAIANHNNPLGSRMPDEAKRELVAILAEQQVPLIEDDIYGDLWHEGGRPSVAKAHDRDGLVMHCASVSKVLAPGYRVGWVAAGRWQARVHELKLAHNLATATPTQLAIADFLENGGYDRHLASVRPVYARRCLLMAQAIAKHFPAGTRATRPLGGFVLWVEMPRAVDSLSLYDLAARAGIAIAPGPIFSAGKGYRNCIRLSAARWGEREEAAIATLGTLVRRMAAKAAR
jgi:DNA-binding transcriptional MocR family regulator